MTKDEFIDSLITALEPVKKGNEKMIESIKMIADTAYTAGYFAGLSIGQKGVLDATEKASNLILGSKNRKTVL
jgi:hypothetical protein